MLIHTPDTISESHRRLVVPQLGTFIVKGAGPERRLFGTAQARRRRAAGLLRAEGMGELEAAGEIDRFVFEIRHAVEHGSEYRLEGFGVMKPGPNATIAFVYEPQPASESPAQEPAAGKRQPLQPEKVAEAVKTAFTEPRVSTSAKMNPDPSVRGLRYGKPPKNTDAYRYVDRVPRRRADRFIWIAVIAALLAVAAIAFGLWRDAREKQAENEYIELPQAAELPSAASQPEQLK